MQNKGFAVDWSTYYLRSLAWKQRKYAEYGQKFFLLKDIS